MDARRPVDNRFTLIVLDPTGRLSVIKRLKLERVRVFEEVCEAEARSRGLKAAESIMRRPLTRLNVMRMTSDGIKFDALNPNRWKTLRFAIRIRRTEFLNNFIDLILPPRITFFTSNF